MCVRFDWLLFSYYFFFNGERSGYESVSLDEESLEDNLSPVCFFKADAVFFG